MYNHKLIYIWNCNFVVLIFLHQNTCIVLIFPFLCYWYCSDLSLSITYILSGHGMPDGIFPKLRNWGQLVTQYSKIRTSCLITKKNIINVTCFDAGGTWPVSNRLFLLNHSYWKETIVLVFLPALHVLKHVCFDLPCFCVIPYQICTFLF